MCKKIIFWGVVLVMAVSLMGCKQESGIEKHKAEVKSMLETYAQERHDNYSSEDWTIVRGIVDNGKAKVDAAENKDDVNAIVNETKKAIGEVLPQEENMDEILKHFDLTDTKILFDETSFSDSMYAEVETIIVIFKKTNTYPKLSIHHFNLSNAKSFAYLQATPDDGHLGWSEHDEGRQEGEIRLIESGKEKILEAVKHLEQLEFVKSVRPRHSVLRHYI
jgi:hypothetical protein